MTPLFTAAALAGLACCAAADPDVSAVERPPVDVKNAHYVSNREPLARTPLVPLPVGAVRPAGWLRTVLERQRDGLNGHLPEISAWLQEEDNAWLSKTGKGKWGWEEVPYWLKGFGDLGYVLGDDRIIAETGKWLEAAFASQREDGNFGPETVFEDDGSLDFWANMIMLFCMQSHYERTGDGRVLRLMTAYFRFQLSVPDDAFLTHFWQRMRGGDNLHSVLWLYNRTGEPWLLDLARKLHRRTANWGMKGDLPNWHNVNIAQGFREPATFAQLSGDPADTRASYDAFFEIRKRFGQVPGGMYGADENARPGHDDPRQAVETCGAVEQMFSDELLLQTTGDPFWGDHAEEVAFNTLPAMMMPDLRALRYLTAPNMVLADSENHSPGVQNAGAFLLMNPFSSRCCQHNHGQGWPYFCERLWMATHDNGLCAALYAPSTVDALVGGGARVTLETDTRYPFEERIRVTVRAAAPADFPLYLRVPAWCAAPAVAVNGGAPQTVAGARGYLRVARTWSDGDTLTLDLPMALRVRVWERNHNSVSVDRGPLTYSLRIGEECRRVPSDSTAVSDSKWRKGADVEAWPSHEIHPSTPWNYGLVLDPADPAASFEAVPGEWPADNFPFVNDGAPVFLRAKGRRIPGWTLDEYLLCAPLQDSPVASDQPVEDIELIPMGGARLRVSAFPVIGDGPNARPWQPEPGQKKKE